uniref:Interferon lambda 1 n=1 Tax=Suricata suricatta TaxID=37032 RepID=A0A673UM43_SURSU
MATAQVLVLVTAGLSLARAGPVPTSRPTTAWRACDFGRFKSLSPRELEAFKKAKDALENSLKTWSCTTRPFPRNRDLRQLQVWERPVALEAELALTLKVLGTMADASHGDILDQPLHTLRHIHSELQACVSAQPTPGPQPRGRLHHWLHRLQEASKKESQSCLEASVLFNLFRLLKKDLECVASGDLCVRTRTRPQI